MINTDYKYINNDRGCKSQITMRNKRIYAGMIDKGVEFFKEGSALYCSYNSTVYKWPDFPSYVKDKIEEEILRSPEAIKALSELSGLTPDMYMYKFIWCRFGGLDDEADIDVTGEVFSSDYVECPIRGQCPAEGRLCLSLQVKNGYLTKRELDVLKRAGKPDKIIADELHISVETVNSHWLNIRQKTELENKSQLAIFASQKGIIINK